MTLTKRFLASAQTNNAVTAAGTLSGALAGSWDAGLTSGATINSVRIYCEVTGANWVDDTWGASAGRGDYAGTSQSDVAYTGSGYGNSTQVFDVTDSAGFGADTYRIDTLDFDFTFSKTKGQDNADLTLTTNSYIEIDFTAAANAIIDVTDWRWYEDGTEGGSTPYEAAFRNAVVPYDTPVHLRFQVQNNGAASQAVRPKLQYSYIVKGTGGAQSWSAWADVTGTSSRINAVASANLTDNGTTTERLAGSNTFTAGRIDESDGAITTAVTLAAGEETEFVFSIEIDSTDTATDREAFRFRLNDQDGLTTYDSAVRTPIINPPMTWEFLYNGSNGVQIADTDSDPDNIDAIVDAGTRQTYTTADSQEGTASGNVDSDGTNPIVNRLWDVNQGRRLYARWYFKNVDGTTTDHRIVDNKAGYEGSDETAYNVHHLNGNIQIRDIDGVLATTTTSLTTGTWYRIEVLYESESDDNANDGTLELRLFVGDSTTATETLGPFTTASTNTELEDFEFGNITGSATIHERWDAIKLSNQDWIGPVSPSGTGAGSLTVTGGDATGAVRRVATAEGSVQIGGGAANLYTEDFTGTNGAAWPSPWTDDSTGVASTEIQGNQGRLSAGPASTDDARIRMAGGFTTSDDFDVLFKATKGNANGVLLLGMMTDGSTFNPGSVNPDNAYFMEINATTFALQKETTGGGFSGLGSVSFTAGTVANWYRMQYDGSTLRCKAWADGTDEPTAWDISVTDTALAATTFEAFVGLEGSTGSNTADVDEVTIIDLATQVAPSLLGTAATNQNSGASSLTTSHTLAVGSNRKVFALVSSDETGVTPLGFSATYGGNAMTLIGDANYIATNQTRALVFEINEANLPADGANDCVVTVTGGPADTLHATVLAVQNVNQATITYVDEDTTQDGSTYSTSWPVSTPNAVHLMVVSGSTDGTHSVTGGPFTELSDQGIASESMQATNHYFDAATGAYTHSGTLSTGMARLAIVTVEAEAAPTGGDGEDATGSVSTNPSGTGSGTVTVTGGDATGLHTGLGTGAGSVAVAGGDATGQRTARETAEGSLTVTGGDATGLHTGLGTGAGSLTVTGGDATAQVTIVGTAEGSLAVAGGDATGLHTGLGTGAGSVTVTGGDAATQRTARESAEGALAVTGGDATGLHTGLGTGAGSVAVTGGDATGQRTAQETAEGALTVTGGDATGLHTGLGTGAGSVSIPSADAVGVLEGNNAGNGQGALVVTGGDAATRVTRKTTGEGSLTVTGGDATGSVTSGNKSGTAEGALTVAGGDATGLHTGLGTGAGSVAVTGGDADTLHTGIGTGAGSVTVSDGSATGTVEGNLTGTGAGSVAVTGGDADTLHTGIGTGAGSVTVTGGDATAQRTAKTTAEGAVAVSSGDAAGTNSGSLAGTGAGSVAVTDGDASGQRTAQETAEGSVTIAGGDASATVVFSSEGAVVVSGGDAVGVATRVATAEGAVTVVSLDPTTQRTAVTVGAGTVTISGGNAFSRSDTSNFNFDAYPRETWGALGGETWGADVRRDRWQTGGVRR